MSNAHAVLELLIYDWGLYSESAKVTLLEELVANYDRLADWMGSFVITELLGEHFRDAEAMGAIESLVARVKMSEPRALLANAVERFIRHRPNVSLLSSPLNYAA
jgi:hypothetical protein